MQFLAKPDTGSPRWKPSHFKTGLGVRDVRLSFTSLRVFARRCLHVKQRRRRRRSCTVRTTVCIGHVTVSVCLNYLAQRPDRGVNQVRSSLLQCFSSLQPHVSTSTRRATDVAELLRYSVCLNKQELSNKRLPTCYGCPLNYGQAEKRKTSIQLNTDVEAPARACVRMRVPLHAT